MSGALTHAVGDSIGVSFHTLGSPLLMSVASAHKERTVQCASADGTQPGLAAFAFSFTASMWAFALSLHAF
jgi:hypothetical protein